MFVIVGPMHEHITVDSEIERKHFIMYSLLNERTRMKSLQYVNRSSQRCVQGLEVNTTEEAKQCSFLLALNYGYFDENEGDFDYNHGEFDDDDCDFDDDDGDFDDDDGDFGF